MKLSTRGRYGMHAMYDLALCGSNAPQPVKSIAERQYIPEAYLEQLIAPLKKAGLVKSVRGAQGGYLLARPPGEITVGQVLRALEGELAETECLSDEGLCDKACSCAPRLVWKRLQDELNQVVDGITLQDMVDDHNRMLLGGA